MAQLADLLPEFPVALPELALAEMHLDSRKIKSGDLFVAISGHQVDGRQFIPQALAAGAAAVLVYGDTPKLVWHTRADGSAAVEITVPALADQLPELAARFYHQPGKQMVMLGVTGTNGKSSVCAMSAQLASLSGRRGAVIGTLGWGQLHALHDTANTTPDAVAIQQMLSRLLAEQTELVAMEVSSHGLVQGRVNGVPLTTAIFTNLSRDHLDYHRDMADYFAAKQRLFRLPSVRQAVINIDDHDGRVLFAELAAELTCCIVGEVEQVAQLDHEQFIAFSDLQRFADGLRCELSSHWGDASLYLPLLGDFNLSNLLCSIAALCLEGFDFHSLVDHASQLHATAGRMELFHKAGHPALVVDYAHTPDALEKALEACRHHCKGQLWVLFGCGGDRDRGKRPLMAAIAERCADRIVVTADNPRTEAQAAITADILDGFSAAAEFEVIEDRASAIRHCFAQATANDLVLIAGKGHENYQLVGDKVLSHDDRQLAELLMEEAL